MKRVFALLGALALCAVSASAADFSGRWATKTSGEMRLLQNGDRVDGSYDLNGGRISGAVSGGQLSAIWAQSLSGRRCARQELGSWYWGRLTVNLSADGKSWSGRWSYCDEQELSGGIWEATRTGDVASHDGPPPNRSFAGRWATKTSGEMRLDQNGAVIEGSYALNSGRIRGEAKGNELSGVWAQSKSGQRCARAEMGSFYWGRFTWRLANDGKRWSGPWTYCDGGTSGTWEADYIGE